MPRPKTQMVDLRRISKALRLLDRHEKSGKEDPEAHTALRFYRMCKKFFAQGGRFKRKYTRKNKTKQ